MCEQGKNPSSEEIIGLSDLEQEYQKAKKLAGDFVLAIDEMLANQPGPKVSDIIARNVEKTLMEYYNGKPGGLELPAESRLGLLQNTSAELGAFLNLPKNPSGFLAGQAIIEQYLYDSGRSDAIPSRQMTAEELAGGQMAIMSELNLGDYENFTTDTGEAIRRLILLLQNPMLLATAKNPDRLNILEPGIGEGRIAMPLLLLGHQVQGIELSPRTIERMRQRITETVSKLSSGESDIYLNQVKEAFTTCGLNFQDIVAHNTDNLNDGLQVSQGDFFKPESFETIEDESIDICPIMWHTFGFAGNRETEMILLKNIYKKLRPGGFLILEMPDPNFGPYAEAINNFDIAEQNKANSDPNYLRYPRGTIIDAPSANNSSPTSENAGVKAIRYFPDTNELIDTLQEAEFMCLESEPYFVGQKTPDGGEILIIKEGLFVAQKPYTKEQTDGLTSRYQQLLKAQPSD